MNSSKTAQKARHEHPRTAPPARAFSCFFFRSSCALANTSWMSSFALARAWSSPNSWMRVVESFAGSGGGWAGGGAAAGSGSGASYLAASLRGKWRSGEAGRE